MPAAVISLHRLNADGSVKRSYVLSGVDAVQATDEFTIAPAALPFAPEVGDVVNAHGVDEGVRVVTDVAGDALTEWVLTAAV